MKISIVLFLLFFLLTVTSCTTIRVGFDLLRYDLDGDKLIRNEVQVKGFLETILLTPDEYMLYAYTRKVFSPEIKKTPALYHSFYVISSSEIPYITLSFSGTKKRPRSRGAWAINTDFDVESYDSYRYGVNEWDVQNVLIVRGINTGLTVLNILYRIDKGFSYFYNDHRNEKNGMENCNTAVQNTLVENI